MILVVCYLTQTHILLNGSVMLIVRTCMWSQRKLITVYLKYNSGGNGLSDPKKEAVGVPTSHIYFNIVFPLKPHTFPPKNVYLRIRIEKISMYYNYLSKTK